MTITALCWYAALLAVLVLSLSLLAAGRAR